MVIESSLGLASLKIPYHQPLGSRQLVALRTIPTRITSADLRVGRQRDQRGSTGINESDGLWMPIWMPMDAMAAAPVLLAGSLRSSAE